MPLVRRVTHAVLAPLLPLLFVTLGTGVASRGQNRASSMGILVGQVVDAAAGKPVGGAVVTLSLSLPPRPPRPPGATVPPADAGLPVSTAPRRIMTDAGGVFVFHTLPAGSFRLNVEAPGFLSGGFGQLRPNGPTRQIDLDEGERRTGLTIKMWPYCSVSGTVLDEFGDPAVGVSLRLIRVTTTNGQRRLAPSSGAQTDDRGMYRFSQLPPGDYLVAVPQTVTSMPLATIDLYMAAITQPDGAASVQQLNRDLQATGAPPISAPGLRIGANQFFTSVGPNRVIAPPSQGDNGKTFAYHTVYYPSAMSAREATTIAVASGQDRSGVDLQLRPVQTVRISGHVSGPDGVMPNMGVKLIPSNDEFFGTDNGFETGSTATDASGTFTFPSVPVGSYTVRALRRPVAAPPPPPPPLPGRGTPMPIRPPIATAASDQVLWAELPVAVSDTDVLGVNVVLRPGAKISGRLAFDGSAPMPTPEQLQRMTVAVSSTDGRPPLVNVPNRVGAGAVFTTAGYPPGQYLVSPGGGLPGWYFQSATVGGRNLEDEPLDLQASDVSGVTLTFTDRITQVSGTVSDPTTTRDMSALVLIFPANYASLLERGTIGRRARSNTVGGTGAFLMTGLVPGNYLAAAVNPDTVTNDRDKAFYDALARIATRFTMADGEKKTLDLTVGMIR